MIYNPGKVDFTINQHANEHKLSSSKLCCLMCVIGDKRTKVGMHFSLTAYRFIDMYTYVACMHRCWTLFIRTYVRTYIPRYRNSNSPLMRDRRTRAPLRNEVRRDLPYRPLSDVYLFTIPSRETFNYSRPRFNIAR